MNVLLAFAAGFGLLSIALMVLAGRAWRRRRWMGTASRTGGAVLLLSLASLAATLAVSTSGYHSLTREEVVATVTTVPTGPRAFQAFVEFPDGRDTTLNVRGDQFLVDAHILKWRYLGNLIGLTTQYELDRMTGRYLDIEDERTMVRTVHSLKRPKPADLFDLAQRYGIVGLLVDAEYGSATYTEVEGPARFEISVSTTGLLVRKIDLP